MAVVNLPDSPANGTTETVNGITYTYNSSKGYWTTASSGTATIQVTTSDSAPSSPADGDLWYDTDTGGIFVYYADGTSNQWVEVIGQQGEQGPQGTLSTSDSAPSSPSDGDLWYDTDVGGLFIYYADGSSNQWVEVVGQQGAQGPAGPSGATTIVADTTALLAISSPSTGEMAYVTGNSTLYFYNGSGWYKIALINTTPSISGANATYSLAIDGTATTVTLVASDPEGLPITYSIASDTSGNIATVAQGTGASTNVWTITPSTNTAHAGTFSLTFRASDGVNFATAVSSFTLQFKVVNSHYTTALITSVGANNATNSSFDDKSTSDHTITTVGDVHQTTFSPYRHGGYSVYFDGTGDFLSVADHSDFEIGSGDFTMEAWIYLTGYSNSYGGYYAGGIMGKDSASNRSFTFSVQGTSNSFTGLQLYLFNGGTSYSTIGTASMGLNQWYHVAATRASGTVKLFLNGTQIQSGTNSTNIDNTASPLVVGASSSYSNYEYRLNGYMKDARFVNGTAVYTSNFTPPTEPLTAITNTKLLACHLPYIADGSTNGHTITVNGNTSTQPLAPYDAQPYSASSHLGSMYFDGTGDRLTFSHASDFSFGTGDFTIEFWMKTDSNAITGGYSRSMMVIGQLHIYMRIAAYHGGTDGAIRVYDETADNDIGNVKMFDDIWHHVAVVRESGTIKCWVDGKYNTGVSNTRSFAETSTNTIGGRPDGNGHFEGNITDIRVVKGTAVYTGTSNFTPPATPLTAITNTSLLLQGTDAGIIDKSQVASRVSLNGGTKSSTGYTKYLSSSMYFDGVDDTITVPQIDIKAGEDFTIECWHYLTSRTDSYPALFGNYSTWGAGGLGLFADHSSYSGGYQVAHNGTFPFLNIGTVTYNQWVHVALVRNGTTMTLYVDGTSAGSGTSGSVALPGVGTSFMIGRSSDNADGHIQGYLSDFRITQGLARYTSNFTAPTAALQG